MKQMPSYYSILTARVRYDKRLKNHADEKVLFSEITALSNKYGYCTASNKYFGELYDRPNSRISKWINHLKELGYLKIVMVKDGKQIISRKIYPVSDPIVVDDNTPLAVDDMTPIVADGKENTTSINTTSSQVSPDRVPYSEIINFLNEQTGKKFSSKSRKNQEFIKARYNEGFLLDDFKKVIKFKTQQWSGDEKMKNYLRPETLFNGKFDRYLNEVPSEPPANEEVVEEHQKIAQIQKYLTGKKKEVSAQERKG